jgi:hypothetical protein
MSLADRQRTVEEAVLTYVGQHGGSVHETEVIFGSAGRFDDGAALVALRDLVKSGKLVRTRDGKQAWYSVGPCSLSPSRSDPPPPGRPLSLTDAAAAVEPADEEKVTLADGRLRTP